MSVNPVLGQNAGAHHGAPDLFERDIKLLQDFTLWITTVRSSNKGSISYGDGWMPHYPDIIKSRLFWRIRSGKAPLERAPPCAYSCPWYELIEEDRPHSLWNEEIRVYEAGHPLLPDTQKTPVVSVAQSFYEVIGEKDGVYTLHFNGYYFKVWKGMIPIVTSSGATEQREGHMIQRLFDYVVNT